MAPLDPTSTARWKYTYQNAVSEHSITFRAVSGSTVAELDEIMQTLISWFGLHSVASTITGLDQALIGSDIFNPVAGSTLIGDSFGDTTANPSNNAVAATFIGRTTGGRRSRFSLFGWKEAVSDYRLTTAEDAGLTGVIAFLNDPDTPLLAIDGLAPVFKSYVDIKANDHWVDEARS